MKTILVADDDVKLCQILKKALSEKGYDVVLCHSAYEVAQVIRSRGPDLFLLSNDMPDQNGMEMFATIKESIPNPLAVIITAFGTMETAIKAMHEGALDYVLKPFHLDDLIYIVEKGLEIPRLMSLSTAIAAPGKTVENGRFIVGRSKAMQGIYKMIGQVAGSNVAVLIQGESGTGKEVVARAIYKHSQRKNGPFLAINCAAIPETLLESELFGYERGAFTGATKRKIGKFEYCNNGTIFLDEIGDMPLSTQVKILRVLHGGEFERIGGNETVKVDVRVLAATNQKLEELIERRKFRKDLYYRLKILCINIPPLRERKEDVRELAKYFFRSYSRELGGRVTHVHPSVFEKMMSYDWPGNIREVANTIHRSLILCKRKVLTADDFVLDSEGKTFSFRNEDELQNSLERTLDPVFKDLLRLRDSGLRSSLLDMIEKFLVKRALEFTKGNQVQSANLLGISRNTLRNRIEKYKSSL